MRLLRITNDMKFLVKIVNEAYKTKP